MKIAVYVWNQKRRNYFERKKFSRAATIAGKFDTGESPFIITRVASLSWGDVQIFLERKN